LVVVKRDAVFFRGAREILALGFVGTVGFLVILNAWFARRSSRRKLRQRDFWEFLDTARDTRTSGVRRFGTVLRGSSLQLQVSKVSNGVKLSSFGRAGGKEKFNIPLSLSISFQTAGPGKFHSKTANWKSPQSLCQFLSKGDFGNS